MIDTAKMWIEQYGIDGIRMDVIDHTFEDPELRDFPPHPRPRGNGHMAKFDWAARWLRPEAYTFAARVANGMREAARKLNKHVVSIGEIAYDEHQPDFTHLVDFYQKGKLDIPFNFALQAAVGHGANARIFKRVWDQYIIQLPPHATPNVVLSNHDQNMRLADKVGQKNIRAITMMLLTLGNRDGSNVFMYMGDELGMVKGNVITPDNMRDPQGINLGIDQSRDHSRTAYPWGGRRRFSDGTAWLPVGVTVDGKSYEEQDKDSNSTLNFTRNMIAARKTDLSALQFGEYIPYESGDDKVLSFGRRTDSQNLVINLNFSDKEKIVLLPHGMKAKIMRSTDSSRAYGIVEGSIILRPHEGCILQLIQ